MKEKKPFFDIDNVNNVNEIPKCIYEEIEKRDLCHKNSSEKLIKKGKICCYNAFEVGDKVLVFKAIKTSKLCSNWFDGYEIIA